MLPSIAAVVNTHSVIRPEMGMALPTAPWVNSFVYIQLIKMPMKFSLSLSHKRKKGMAGSREK